MATSTASDDAASVATGALPGHDAASRAGSQASGPPRGQLSYDVSRLMRLPYEILRRSAECSAHRAANVTDPDSNGYWDTGSSSRQSITLKLDRTALVGFVRLFNRGVSALELAVAQSDEPGSYVTVYSASGGRVPHNKIVVCRAGFLPCRFIRLTLLRGTPVSLYSIDPLGVPTDDVERAYGPHLRAMLVDHTLQTYFDPVKPRRARVPESQWSAFPIAVTYPPKTRATSAARHRPAAPEARVVRERRKSRQRLTRRTGLGRTESAMELERLANAPGLDKLRAPCVLEL